MRTPCPSRWRRYSYTSWEVRDVKSATLHFERGIFAKSVLRFWPIWAVYAFIWMLVLPVSIIDTLTRWTATDANSLVLNSIPNTAVMLCPAAACAAAMAVFSHLYSERSAGFFAALPVDRGSMFLSLAAAGLLPLMAANPARVPRISGCGGAVRRLRPRARWHSGLAPSPC